MKKLKQKKEALIRMKMLGLHASVINEFKEDEILNASEGSGFLYWLNDDDKKWVQEWQNKTGNLVYHIIKTDTPVGQLMSILYISKYEEEWEIEKDEMQYGILLAYVRNINIEEFSEYGRIGIQKAFGGLVRVN